MMDWGKGANELASGNFEKAAELMVPVKFIADSLRAYRESTEGKKNASGLQTMTPYTPYEAGVRALGFTPSREAEQGAQTGHFYSVKQREQKARSSLINAWVNAEPGEKAEALKAVQKYNKGVAPELQVKMSDLTSASKRRKTEEKSQIGGIKTSKKDRRILEDSPYNVLP
jgi:hypothetical protein